MDEAGISVSSGSACSLHKKNDPSRALTALGFDPLRARGSLRITLGRFNTESDVEYFLNRIPDILSSLKPISTHN
jgi:cysteine desulfurase